MTPRSLAPLLLFAVPACTDPAYVAPPVRVATPAEVATCTPVRSYRTPLEVYGPLAEAAITDARRRTLISAAADGADAVVFAAPPDGTVQTSVEATAYAC